MPHVRRALQAERQTSVARGGQRPAIPLRRERWFISLEFKKPPKGLRSSLSSFVCAACKVLLPAMQRQKPTATSIRRSCDDGMQPSAQQNPSPVPSRRRQHVAGDRQVTQSQQGRQYGQPGFVGEPINLNVVNADIRDILNYITEQYGVNFVIDSFSRRSAGDGQCSGRSLEHCARCGAQGEPARHRNQRQHSARGDHRSAGERSRRRRR